MYEVMLPCPYVVDHTNMCIFSRVPLFLCIFIITTKYIVQSRGKKIKRNKQPSYEEISKHFDRKCFVNQGLSQVESKY